MLGPLSEIARQRQVPLVALVLDTLRRLRRPVTLLAVCPNSEAVTRAALVSAQTHDYPLLLAATLNQVDLDGGYTGWTPSDLSAFVRRSAGQLGFKGDVAICSDHCGPYCKDRHRLEAWPLAPSMWGAGVSLVACMQAGYDLLHVDPTVDITLPGGPDMGTVVARTVELIAGVERFRRLGGYPAVGYEVGTEEVQGGGLSGDRSLRRFLERLRSGLMAAGLADVWPQFVVGGVGTELHTARFDPPTASALVAVADAFGAAVKGHYTDGCENLDAYPASGMGGANVGPDLTMAEYQALEALADTEARLAADGRCMASYFLETLEQAVVRSGRWEKWRLPDEKGRDFSELSTHRRRWMVQACSRYVWRTPEVVSARRRLMETLSDQGIDGERQVVDAVAVRLQRYVAAFNLEGTASALLAYLSPSP